MTDTKKTTKAKIIKMLRLAIEERQSEIAHNQKVLETCEGTIKGTALLREGLEKEIYQLNNCIKYIEENG